MNEKKAQNIVESVKQVYNAVATPFIASRTRDWREFEVLIKNIPIDAHVLDAGCAHGRLVPLLLAHGITKENYTGIDISEKLITHARATFPEMSFTFGNVCVLPYEAERFDIVISSAVLHHIPSRALRIAMIQEMYRVLRPDGKVHLLVWNAFYFPHLRKHIIWSYIKSIFTIGLHEAGDMNLTFFGKRNIRYVHAFTIHSLKKIFKDAGIAKIVIIPTGKNYYIIIKK